MADEHDIPAETIDEAGHRGHVVFERDLPVDRIVGVKAGKSDGVGDDASPLQRGSDLVPGPASQPKTRHKDGVCGDGVLDVGHATNVGHSQCHRTSPFLQDSGWLEPNRPPVRNRRGAAPG